MIRANPCRTSSAGINSGMTRAGAPPSALRASADGSAAKKESADKAGKAHRLETPNPAACSVSEPRFRSSSGTSARALPARVRDIPAISRKLLHMHGILRVSSGSTRRRVDHIREFNTEIVSRHSRKSMTSGGARLNVGFILLHAGVDERLPVVLLPQPHERFDRRIGRRGADRQMRRIPYSAPSPESHRRCAASGTDSADPASRRDPRTHGGRRAAVRRPPALPFDACWMR